MIHNILQKQYMYVLIVPSYILLLQCLSVLHLSFKYGPLRPYTSAIVAGGSA